MIKTRSKTRPKDRRFSFNYKVVSNQQGNSSQLWQNLVPYASVGISSPDGKTGLNYTYNNVYPKSCPQLAAQVALQFAQLPRYKTGKLYGWVLDVATGEPIVKRIYYQCNRARSQDKR